MPISTPWLALVALAGLALLAERIRLSVTDRRRADGDRRCDADGTGSRRNSPETAG